ncbi:hypothetical protein N7499_003539 [Penicillium canescens]|uniref:uncharacterized protein n=1 Tax=Penicillium canescens TaxID=5083 RepID=UPI0026DEE358|nr:uncharacterized protein N7446_012463 [Penicillium canescens]KAJ6045599.1 hypothetical protein N7446_012463 [Penicillium canescens]KAJ6090825.1 hypothetical protein N7499_003539 [Penicillium canescens]
MLLRTVLSVAIFAQASFGAALNKRDDHGWCYCYRKGIPDTGELAHGLDTGLTGNVCGKFPVSVTFSELDSKAWSPSSLE